MRFGEMGQLNELVIKMWSSTLKVKIVAAITTFNYTYYIIQIMYCKLLTFKNLNYLYLGIHNMYKLCIVKKDY